MRAVKNHDAVSNATRLERRQDVRDRISFLVRQEEEVLVALPPKADIGTQPRNVRFVQKTDVAEPKCYVLRKTQTSVDCRTEPSRSSARFYIGALCNSAIKLAAPKRAGPLLFCVCAYPTLMVARPSFARPHGLGGITVGPVQSCGRSSTNNMRSGWSVLFSAVCTRFPVSKK